MSPKATDRALDTDVQTRASLPSYASILLAVDSSDHSNRAVLEARAIASLWGSKVTAAHVYAARMHDTRFKQMEGGLPEQFRQEQELERQRDVHDDLITRGLSVITDSYLDQAERAFAEDGIEVARRSLEGKNYRALVRESESGGYDLLVIGALGLGSISGSRLGTVCGRVARRSDIDTLVIRDPQRHLADGPIVVAVDGSPRSYGGLLTALSLAGQWGSPVKVVAAFDPYYHYVAFNRIAGVLSEEAGKVFRFKEQEKLHEEIIDSGLAKIYQGHLSVAESVAANFDLVVETVLLDGKPHDAIEKYLHNVKPSLLVIGKLGIHADPELDIGGNAEHLLRNVDCAVLLSQREYTPPVDAVADVTTSWTVEAERRMGNVPSFVRNMARMAILRYAQERGHTVITERIVEEATAELMPGRAEELMQEIVDAHDAGELKTAQKDEPMRWADDAKALLMTVDDLSLRGNLCMRAEKKARAAASRVVELDHIKAFLEQQASAPEPKSAAATGVHWQAAALARLMRVPEGFMRDTTRERIENYARQHGMAEITLELLEEGLAKARKAMEEAMKAGADAGAGGGSSSQQSDVVSTSQQSKCPFAGPAHGEAQADRPEGTLNDGPAVRWQESGLARLDAIPIGFCREMTIKATETIAAKEGISEIDEAFVNQIMETFQAGAEAVAETLPWEVNARIRVNRTPDMIRGMLIREIEAWARRNNLGRVDERAVDAVKDEWKQRGVFHLDPADQRSGK